MSRRRDVTVTGTIDEPIDGGRVHYYAAAPPDYMLNYTGSALPFPNARSAFEGTPNRGDIVVAPGGRFEVALLYPNAYYVALGSEYVPPTLFLRFTSGGRERLVRIKVGHGVPFRSLAPPGRGHPCAPRDGPEFYDNRDLEVRSQEAILRASGYPDKNIWGPRQPDGKESFWGTRPPF